MPERVLDVTILRHEWPAIMRVDGVLYQENFDIDTNHHRWVEITEPYARHWLGSAEPARGES